MTEKRKNICRGDVANPSPTKAVEVIAYPTKATGLQPKFSQRAPQAMVEKCHMKRWELRIQAVTVDEAPIAIKGSENMMPKLMPMEIMEH